MRVTRAVIHLDNLRGNILKVRKKIGKKRLLCMPVKADAYGHGAPAVSRAALDAGVDYLAVAFAAEAMELREGGITAPILLLSQALREELPEIIKNDLIPLIADEDFIDEAARAAEAAGKRLVVHLKVDTGMGRLGCRKEEALALAARIVSCKSLLLGGIATHLAVSDSAEEADIAYTCGQLSGFRDIVSAVKKAGIEPGIIHAANSGGFEFHEDSYFDMVRPGIFLYGYSGLANPGHYKPLPLMELRSAVVVVKKVKKGQTISYGRTWTAPQDTVIAVIPAGYGDGFPRRLSNNHAVRIGSGTYPLVGRVCMDHFMVDLGKNSGANEVRRWDEAILFGPGFTNAQDIAEKTGTIPYEITCNITKRVPRVYTG